MSKGKKDKKGSKRAIIPRTSLIEQLSTVVRVVDHESPLACVLVAASYVEQQLGTLLSAYLITGETAKEMLTKDGGCLATLSSRAKMVYCLGLVGKELFQNLDLIRQIRNRFAHSHSPLDFDDDDVKEWCGQLAFPFEEPIDEGDDEAETQHIAWGLQDTSPRHRFTSVAILVAFDLMSLIERVTNGEAFSRRVRLPDRWPSPPLTVPFTAIEQYFKTGFQIDNDY